VAPSDRPTLFAPYVEYAGPALPDPREVKADVVAEGLYDIIGAEGPMLVDRAYHVYLRSCSIHRMGGELRTRMAQALGFCLQQKWVVLEDEMGAGEPIQSIVRSTEGAPVILRQRGSRTFEELPPSEVLIAARLAASLGTQLWGTEPHCRAILEAFDLIRLTAQTQGRLAKILEKQFAYVDEWLAAHTT